MTRLIPILCVILLPSLSHARSSELANRAQHLQSKVSQAQKELREGTLRSQNRATFLTGSLGISALWGVGVQGAVGVMDYKDRRHLAGRVETGFNRGLSAGATVGVERIFNHATYTKGNIMKESDNGKAYSLSNDLLGKGHKVRAGLGVVVGGNLRPKRAGAFSMEVGLGAGASDSRFYFNTAHLSKRLSWRTPTKRKLDRIQASADRIAAKLSSGSALSPRKLNRQLTRLENKLARITRK